MESIQVGSNALIMEVLDRNNYKHWRSRLKTYLLAEDLWEVVEAIRETPKLKGDQADYKAWTIKNAKALYAIQNSCGRELFSFISEIETARSAWETLERECEVMQGFDENNSDHLERYKSFVRYVESGDWDKAKKCLREIDVRSVLEVRAIDGRNGTTALHVAAMEGHARIVKDLVHLMTQEDLKTKTDSGHTALHLAAQQGHVHVVKELPVQLMGEVQDKGGHTALHYAVHAGKVDVVKELLLLMRQDDFLQIKNKDGDTALHIAVQKGNVDIVKELVLLMRQEDLKTKNDAGYTALHLAVSKGNVPMVKPFVIKEKGEANIGEDEFERYIPFTTYVTTGDRDKAKGCLKELDDPCGAVTVVDPRDDLRETALHVAARRGHVDVIKELLLLLKRREEDHLELKTAEDFTIFGSGISLGVSEEFLMARAKYMVEQYEKTLGSILEIQNYNGSTPLHVAVIEGHAHIVKELVHFMRKEGLEKQNHYGESPLHVAVIKENVLIVKELVQFMRKEGLEIQNRYGESPLHVAVIKQNVRIVKELVPWMRRDGMEIKDSGGSYALHRAVRNRHVQIVKELTLCMIPEALEIKDGQGYTALGRALNVGRDRDAMEMARYMAERNHKVVGIPGPFDDDDIPVVSALRGGLWKSARYLYSITPPEVLHGSNGSQFICYCLNSSRTLDMAWDLLQRYPILAMTVYETYKTSPMLRLASMRFAFLSATRLTRLQRWIYDCIHIGDYQVNNLDISINVVESKHGHDDKRSFISSVMNSFRRFSKGVGKFCGIDFIYHMKSTHEWIFLFLHCMGETTKYHHLTPEQLEMVKKSVFVAIEKGHFEFVTRLCKTNPRILTDTYDEHGRTIFHVAVQYRQEEVYSLMYGLDEEKQSEIGITLVNTDYNLLHIAADLFSGSYGDRIQDASLRLQRELQWFKEVGSIVPIEMHEYRRHSDGLTARELFTKTHKNLIEDAKSSMIETAHSCTVIGALIVTMMFAATFTLPGGNNGNTGLPFFQDNKLLKVFIVSDTISLVSSTISVITFLGILTSSYAEDDFLKYLLTMTKIGIFTLFFSIVTMMIVFSSALAIMLEGEAWIVIPSILFASLPALYFSWLLFPLLGKMFKSTYGPGRFGRRRKV
ncbi:PREDICTED: alpha-latrotoxin-Lh1a-like [Fragaria vesca subsp. vesca]